MDSASQPNKNVQTVDQLAALEFILLGDLRDLLEEPPDHLTGRWLTAVLDALLDTLPREFKSQEAGGYMADVLESFPNWTGHVTELRQERDTLFSKLKELRDQLAGKQSYRSIATELQRDLRDWMKSVTAFHRHERRLIQTAFNLEVGIGD